MPLYMLDTDTCSFIMRKASSEVIKRLETAQQNRYRLVISAITYSEIRYGEIGSKAPAKLAGVISDFMECIDGVLPWGAKAIDKTIEIQKRLAQRGTPIGINDAAIAGHAIIANAILVTNNTREYSRVEGLQLENWL